MMNSLLSSIILQLVQDDGNFRGIWLWRVPCRAEFQVHYLLDYTYVSICIGEDTRTRVLLFIATDATRAVLDNTFRNGRSLFLLSRKRPLLISYYKSIISLLLLAKTSSHLHRPGQVFDSLYYSQTFSLSTSIMLVYVDPPNEFRARSLGVACASLLICMAQHFVS